MENLTQTVKDLLKSSLKSTDLWRVLDKLSKGERETYSILKKASRFKPECKTGNPTEKVSPSGKYKLVIERFSQEGGWSYTQGTIYREGSREPVGVVQRNYGVFPFCWVEGHPNGHDYLVAGEDYQGQTVVELDTGTLKDFLPEEAKEGHGFCWSSYTYNPDFKVLVVDGCYWACPYESRLYDFSNPMKGWPQIKVYDENGEETCIYADEDKAPTLSEDGEFTVYQTKDIYDYKSDYEVEDVSDVEWEGPEPTDPDNDERYVTVATTTYKLQEGELVYGSHWTSEIEKAYRIEQERRRKAYEEAEAKFKAEDPLYLAYMEELKDPILRPEKYQSRGHTHDKWHPDQKYEETRWCRRIYSPEKADKYDKPKGYTLDFEWAVKTGPVKLIVYKDGKHVEDKFWMDHSVESVRSAFTYAKDLLRGST